jgi:hypothetical protein
MKTINKCKNLWRGFTGAILVAMLLAANSCKKQDLQESSSDPVISVPIVWSSGESAAATGNGMQTTTASFSAVAAVKYCWGEDVRFYGTIENKVVQVTDASGTVHYTRHWSIKGLDAVGMGNPLTGLAAGTVYTVVAGAEMFTVTNPAFNAGGIPQAGSSGQIYIHQGTIVLENSSSGDRLVARHIIHKNPRTGVVSSNWLCMGN